MKIKVEWLPHLHKVRRRELDLIFSKCPEKLFQTGLELGAGDGFQSTLITKYVSKLISTDYNPNILKKGSGESIEYLMCDAEEVDNIFSKRQFDLVFSSNLLEHVPNPDRVLKGIYEVLKDDGITIHLMPSPFWKSCQLLLHYPNICVRALEIITKGELNKMLRKTKGSNNLELNEQEQELGNNPKIQRVPKSFLHRLLVPEPHGVSSGNIKEFYAFSKSRWKKEFEKANLDLMAIVRGPVTSAYGFGFDFIRNILERLGLTSEYIYIAIKKGKNSRYKQYFHFSLPK